MLVTAAAVVILAVLFGAVPALADHGAPFRTDGMSPLTSALLTAALAFVAALVVVVVVMLLTKPKQDQK